MACQVTLLANDACSPPMIIPAATVLFVDRVNEDEAAGRAIPSVGIEHQWLLSSQPHPTDLIQPEPSADFVPVQRVDVESVFEHLDRCRD